jgi:hypothetical protein
VVPTIVGWSLLCPKSDVQIRLLGVANCLMRVIPRLGYRLTEFAYLAAASQATRAGGLGLPCKPDGYLLGSYRIATTPEPNSSRLTSFKSMRFDRPANNVGP